VRTAIEKLIARVGIRKKLSNSGFINPDGTYIGCLSGADHVRSCKCAGTTLNQYYSVGGIRVFNYANEIAIEHRKSITDEQKQAIINLARWNLIERITINTETVICDGGYYGLRSMGNAVRKMLND